MKNQDPVKPPVRIPDGVATRVREWAYIVSIITGSVAASVGGVTMISGTPNQTKDAITEQTEHISSDLQKLIDTVESNSVLVHQNTIRIYELEMNDDDIVRDIDSLHKLTEEGLRNLDGYFRGRLDQIGNE